MGRGRLIQKFKASIARLDTDAIEAGGYYDDDFREVTASSGSADGIGTIQRQEHAAVIIPCQIGPRAWEQFRAFDQGNVPRSDLTILFHFRDLERLSLVDATSGEALIHAGDRLVSILDYKTETVVQAIRTPPGLYVDQANPSGWGINMSRPRRNLLRVTLKPRDAVV